MNPTRETTIDRIDNERGYEPGNCRWASTKVQANNRRNSRIFVIGGESRTLTQWAERVAIRPTTVYSRLAKGWPIERALFSPVRP